MNSLSRLFISLRSNVDGLVANIENHDAVVDAALKGSRLAVAKAKMQLGRVHKDMAATKRRIEEEQAKAQLWEKRATLSAKDDEAQAMECLARRNQCQQAVARAEQLLAQLQPVERKLQKHVSAMEARLKEVMQQQHTLRARQSSAEAQRVLSALSHNASDTIEDMFERWETCIVEQEYGAETAQDYDEMEARFDAQEQRDALQVELQELLRAQKGDQS